MSKRVFVFVSLFSLAFVATIFFVSRANTATIVFANGTQLTAEVVRTDADRARGLSGHAPLTDQQGMLFVWNEPAEQTFWMKDMTFPIDIIWLRQGQVIQMDKEVPVPTSDEDENLPRYASLQPVDMVLELAAGWADRHALTVGQTISIDP